MKTKTKALVLAACAILLVVTTVFATMAFLTSQDTVVNTFTVGNVKINLDEAEVDEMGVKDGTTRTETGNEYKLLPGHTYTKDPTVTVLAGSEECYVRILVTLDKIDTIDTLFPNADLTKIFNDISSDWTAAGAAKGDGTRTYEFRYKETVDASESDEDITLAALFSGFTMPDDLTGEQIATLKDAKMTIVAEAIQADGFDDADAAWAAFPAPEVN